ncbi:MAG: hypothetical protein JXA03_14370, partial [Bacteroidales bacterium]|nr:hypothetical protein [Bacteroidales bacterium]
GVPFTPLSLPELLDEMRRLVDSLELNRSHFRCDHVSNFLPIQGVLGRDKTTMLSTIDAFAESIPFTTDPYLPVVG